MSSPDSRGRAPLRVVLLTAPAPIGGLETVVSTLAQGLADCGHAVSLVQLLTPDAESARAMTKLDHPGITQHLLRHGGRDYAGEVREVRALLHRVSADVLHSHGQRADLVGLFAARRTGANAATPHVSTVHGFVANSFMGRVAHRVHLQVLARTTRVVSVSQPLFEQLGQPVGRSRVVLLPNAVPTFKVLTRDEARAALSLPDGAPVVGWIGRVSVEKGPDLFVAALARLESDTYRGVVIGDGPQLDAVRQQASSLGIADRITFTGALPDAARLLSAFDALVLSSRTEGTPMTVLEAMYAGVPVVATSVGGVPQLLSNDASWLVPPESPEALANAMRDLLAHPDMANQRAANARSRADSLYSVSSWTDAHVHLYRELART